jgi:hypothetical protein
MKKTKTKRRPMMKMMASSPLRYDGEVARDFGFRLIRESKRMKRPVEAPLTKGLEEAVLAANAVYPLTWTFSGEHRHFWGTDGTWEVRLIKLKEKPEVYMRGPLANLEPIPIGGTGDGVLFSFERRKFLIECSQKEKKPVSAIWNNDLEQAFRAKEHHCWANENNSVIFWSADSKGDWEVRLRKNFQAEGPEERSSVPVDRSVLVDRFAKLSKENQIKITMLIDELLKPKATGVKIWLTIPYTVNNTGCSNTQNIIAALRDQITAKLPGLKIFAIGSEELFD